jgi:hypothetical protein
MTSGPMMSSPASWFDELHEEEPESSSKGGQVPQRMPAASQRAEITIESPITPSTAPAVVEVTEYASTSKQGMLWVPAKDGSLQGRFVKSNGFYVHYYGHNGKRWSRDGRFDLRNVELLSVAPNHADAIEFRLVEGSR